MYILLILRCKWKTSRYPKHHWSKNRIAVCPTNLIALCLAQMLSGLNFIKGMILPSVRLVTPKVSLRISAYISMRTVTLTRPRPVKELMIMVNDTTSSTWMFSNSYNLGNYYDEEDDDAEGHVYFTEVRLSLGWTHKEPCKTKFNFYRR